MSTATTSAGGPALARSRSVGTSSQRTAPVRRGSSSAGGFSPPRSPSCELEKKPNRAVKSPRGGGVSRLRTSTPKRTPLAHRGARCAGPGCRLCVETPHSPAQHFRKPLISVAVVDFTIDANYGEVLSAAVGPLWRRLSMRNVAGIHRTVISWVLISSPVTGGAGTPGRENVRFHAAGRPVSQAHHR